MEKLFELTFQDQTLNPQVGTFTDASQATGTFTLEDGEYYLTNADTKGFYAYAPIAIQPDSETDNKVTVEFDLKVVTASVNTHTIIGTYAGVDGSGIPTGAKITLQYTAGDIELVLGSGTTETLIAAADVVVDQWYHFCIDCALDAPVESTYEVKIDGAAVTTVTGATTDYELGIIGVLGTDLHACDECGIKNIRLVTDDDYFVGRTALNQAFKDTKGYVDVHCMDLTSTQTAGGDKAFTGTTTTRDVIPETTDTYDIGSAAKEYNNAYIKALTVNGSAAGNILTHNTSEFVSVGGGNVMAGNTLGRNVDDSDFRITGGATWYSGSVIVTGANRVNEYGAVHIHPSNHSSWHDMILKPNGDWIWNGTACQITSDQRLKQQIAEIDDKLLDAWEDVNLVQFKYNDAVDQKGKDKARLHTGYVVQQIDNACKSHNVDISDYGLYCHEEYPEETEEVEVEQKDGTKAKETRVIREASEHYSLRYTEVYAVECMYLRRCIARLTARIEQLEKEQEAGK